MISREEGFDATDAQAFVFTVIAAHDIIIVPDEYLVRIFMRWRWRLELYDTYLLLECSGGNNGGKDAMNRVPPVVVCIILALYVAVCICGLVVPD